MPGDEKVWSVHQSVPIVPHEYTTVRENVQDHFPHLVFFFSSHYIYSSPQVLLKNAEGYGYDLTTELHYFK